MQGNYANISAYNISLYLIFSGERVYSGNIGKKQKEHKMVQITDLLTEYKKNPVGMDEFAPRFSYRITGECRKQIMRQIRVWKENGECVWDSSFVESDDTSQIPYLGKTLEKFTRYYWSVAVKDDKGNIVESGTDNYFETAFMGRKWTGKWISDMIPSGRDMLTAPHRFFRDFELDEMPVKARLYSSALGVYVPYLNGKRISEDLFLPGWTNYFDRVQYQTFDVTSFLQKGDNTLGILLGSGWFSGRIAGNWSCDASSAGRHALFCGELHLYFADGSKKVIVSDEEFRYFYEDGAIRMSDIYMGENYDARREDDWNLPGTGKLSRRNHNVLIENPGVKMTWTSGASVHRIQEITPQKITKMPSGVYMVDFGQNFAGRERLYLKNTFNGQTITVRHGEMLNEDGSLYEENYRKAAATTVYTCKTAENSVYEPEFTFYGFRYVEISGWNGELTKENIRGIVLSSDLPRCGAFSCSDEMINQLYSNITWGQKSNFVDVPTDCPQRDERYGWTGDTQIFCNMATWNSFAPDFYTKWITDLNSDIMDSGCYPYFSPNPFGRPQAEDLLKDFHPYTRYGIYCTGWSDAGIVCPWIMYQKYADTRLIGKFLPNMLRQMDHVAASSDDFIVDAGHFKDWLNIDQPTNSKFLGTAYFAGMALLMAKMAECVGRKEDSLRMLALHEAVKDAFRKKFFTADGNIFIEETTKHCITKEVMHVPCTQTAALLTLYFDLAPEGAAEKVLQWLVNDITVTKKNHLATGFLGTPLLMKVLTQYGRSDVACSLLLQTTYPSWLYPVTQGATTMWERWNSYTKETGFGDINMNSFNHYAYGAVGDWFFEYLCGIRSCPEKSGTTPFKYFILGPCFCKEFSHAECSFDSMSGKIVSEWKREEGSPEIVQWHFTVPCNSTAEILFPGTLLDTEGLEKITHEKYLASSGSYTVRIKMP